MGEILDERKYENINFFEYKPSKNKNIPTIEVRQGSVCVPLERNENLNINYNPTTNVNNFSSINTNITHGPQNPFFFPNPNLPNYYPNLNPSSNPSLNPSLNAPSLNAPPSFYPTPFIRGMPGMELPYPHMPHMFMPRPFEYDRLNMNITNITQYNIN
jgi:hypothetical protein